MGARYTVSENYKILAGKPDIVLTKYKIAIFFATASFGTDITGKRKNPK